MVGIVLLGHWNFLGWSVFPRNSTSYKVDLGEFEVYLHGWF